MSKYAFHYDIPFMCSRVGYDFIRVVWVQLKCTGSQEVT